MRAPLIIAVFAVAAAIAPARAQRVEPSTLRNEVVTQTWSRAFPGNSVQSIAQGRDGFLLVAINGGGLGVFDGVRFSVHGAYAASYTDSLPDPYLHDVTVAQDGAVWLATMHSGVVERRGGAFRSYSTAQGLPDADATVVLQDDQGVLWAGTRSGVARFVGGRFERVAGTSKLDVTALASVVPGELWIGTGGGLWRAQGSQVTLLDDGWLRSLRVEQLYVGHDRTLWVASAQGVGRFTRDRRGRYALTRVYGTRDGLRSSFVTGITETSDGTIWVGTGGGGIARLGADDRFTAMGIGEGLPDNNITSIFADRDGTVWAATVGELTSVRRPMLGNWHARGFWSTSLVWSVRADADGTIWAGTGGDGVVRLARDGSTREFTARDGLPSEAVLTTYRARDGTLWVGTRRGIVRMVGDRFVDETRRFGLPPTATRTITEDASGRMIVGTDSGIVVGRGRRFTRLRYTAGAFQGRVYCVAQDHAGRLWVAGSGLALIEGDSLRQYVSAQRTSVDQGMDVLPDSVGLWVVDYVRGLTLIRNDSVFVFPPDRLSLRAKGLRVVDDRRGTLWITSEEGLQRVRKADLLSWLADSTHHVTSRLFTKEDGLRSHDFSKGGNASGSVAPDGRLWFPTSSGLVVVDPGALKIDATVPHVYIERILADDQPLATHGIVALPSGAHEVRIEFTTPVLSSPSHARLWYRLEGVDSAWRTLKDPMSRVAVYRDVPRGKHTFAVRGESADGIPADAEASVVLVASLPWTRNPLVWAVLFLLAGGAATLFHRRRTNRLRAQAAVLQGLVDERTASLEARERLEQQLLHAQKLESVGRLAGGVAHDLNNQLTAILGHAELALSEGTATGQLRDDLQEVRTVAMRAANLTRQLLAFARKQVVQPRLVKVGEVAAGMHAMVQRLLPEQVTFTLETREGDWAVFADPTQIEQVIMNLALNGRDAMPDGGELVVRTRAQVISVEFGASHPEFAPGDYVVLEVSDTGVGMPAHVQAHLFEPFFTTKEQGKGTGLGLATVFGIVNQCGGHILVESAVGQGSTFRVYLPRRAGVAEHEHRNTPAAMPRGHERLLVVEDEEAVRTVAERTLRSLGYDVTTARDGMDALALLQSAEGRFHLVLTDVRMPRMDGLTLARKTLEYWPTLPIALMSGHSEALLDADDPLARHAMLQKPFVASDLALFVRAALPVS